MVAQREHIAHLQRRLAGQEDLRIGHIKAAAEILLEMVADRAVELDAHHRHAAALAQQLFHLFAEVALIRAKGLVVRVDVRIAGDAEHGFFQHVVHLEHIARVFEQDVLDRHIARLVARQEHQRGQRSGHGQQAEALALFMAEQSGDVQHLALEMREGMVRVHNLRGEHGRDHIFEILFDELVLRGFKLADGQAAQPLGAQAFVHVLKRMVAALVERLDRCIDAAQLLLGGHAGFIVDAVFIHSSHVAQAAHADHEKFIQIAGEDGEELAPLEQRNRVILRFGEHAGIELQPREFAVLRIALFPDSLCHGCISPCMFVRAAQGIRGHIINQYILIILHFYRVTMYFSVKIM